MQRGAAFTPLRRTHGLRRENVAGRWPVKRRKRRAPGALPRHSRESVSEFGLRHPQIWFSICGRPESAGKSAFPRPHASANFAKLSSINVVF